MTTEEAVALLLGGQSCEGCGSALTPDEPCGQCGRIPPVTGPQLARDLSSPLVVAEVEAAQAEADGYVMLDAAIARLHEADRARMTGRLQLDRDEAQAALDKAQAEHQALLKDPALAAARREEKQARLALERNETEHAEIARAEEVARSYEHGVKAEAEAKKLLNEADAALARYTRKHALAAGPLAEKKAAITAKVSEVTLLKGRLAEANARLASPGRVPYGPKTIAAGLLRLVMGNMMTGEQLSEAEKLLAGRVARQVCSITGALDGVVAQAREELLAEQEQAAKGKAMHLRTTRDGVTASANPHNSAVPQPFHPPSGPPHPVQPAATPGW